MGVTVAQAMPQVRAAVPAPTLRTYSTGLDTLVRHFGDRTLDSIGAQDIRELRDAVERRSGRRLVDRAVRRGRELRSYDPRAHGQGAAANFVLATRFLFTYAVDAGWVSVNPAARVRPPRRHPSVRRPLEPAELAEIWRIGTTTGMDPELDRLLLTFLRHTAARRSGCLNLTRAALRPQWGQVILSEKYGHTRVLPLRASLAQALLRFSADRGGVRPSDAVFRYANGTPLTRRRFNSLFDRIDRHTDFTEALDVSAHWIRHTTLADIAAVSDLRVAAAYAGHAPEALGVIGRYTAVTFEDLTDAYAAVFGLDQDRPAQPGPR